MEENFDVVFVVEEERFPENRARLSANSPKLRKLLKKRTREPTLQEINLPDLRAEVWQMALDYIYLEKISLSGTSICLELLGCACSYQLETLQDALLNHLQSAAHVSNCCEIFAVGHRLVYESFGRMPLNYGTEFLSAACVEHIGAAGRQSSGKGPCE